MQGVWWELKIQLEPEEYAKLRDLAAHAGKDVTSLVREIIRHFLETSSAGPLPSSK